MNRAHPTLLATFFLVSVAACATEDVAETTDLADPAEPAAGCELLDKVEIVDGLVIFEGDIILGTEDEIDELCASADPDAPVAQGIGIDGNRWSGGVVYYTIDPALPQKSRVNDAITAWEAATSIDFQLRTTQSDYVRFTNGNQCASAVGRKGGRQDIVLSTGKSPTDIVGMGIAGSSDWVYTWYSDGMVSAGTSDELDARRVQYPYSLPPGYSTSDIVGIAIAKSNDRVYTWYDNGKVSVGTSSNLDKYAAPYSYSLPPGYGVGDIVGIGINSIDRVYVWYDDGKVSIGSSSNLDAYSAPYSYSRPPGYTTSDIVAMGIAGSSDWVYAWYDDGKASAGHSNDLDTRRSPYSYSTPGHCGTNTVIHEIGHAVGLAHEHTRCDRNSFVRVFTDNIQSGKAHNFDRHCSGYTDYGSYDFSSIMHYHSWGFSATGSPTLLRKPSKGVAVSGVVASAIASNDWIYTWWSDGTVTAGHSNDLESRRSRYEFELPPGYAIGDIVGIGIAKSTDRVYTFYDNGKVSVGSTADLDAHAAPYSYSLPPGYTPSDILDVGIAGDDHVYVWFDNGKVSSGTSSDLDRYRAPYNFYVAAGYTRGDLLGIGIAGSNDWVYAWYDNGRVSAGHTDDLDDRKSPYTYGARGILLYTNSGLSAGDINAVETMY